MFSTCAGGVRASYSTFPTANWTETHSEAHPDDGRPIMLHFQWLLRRPFHILACFMFAFITFKPNKGNTFRIYKHREMKMSEKRLEVGLTHAGNDFQVFACLDCWKSTHYVNFYVIIAWYLHNVFRFAKKCFFCF